MVRVRNISTTSLMSWARNQAAIAVKRTRFSAMLRSGARSAHLSPLARAAGVLGLAEHILHAQLGLIQDLIAEAGQSHPLFVAGDRVFQGQRPRLQLVDGALQTLED